METSCAIRGGVAPKPLRAEGLVPPKRMEVQRPMLWTCSFQGPSLSQTGPFLHGQRLLPCRKLLHLGTNFFFSSKLSTLSSSLLINNIARQSSDLKIQWVEKTALGWGGLLLRLLPDSCRLHGTMEGVNSVGPDTWGCRVICGVP